MRIRSRGGTCTADRPLDAVDDGRERPRADQSIHGLRIRRVAQLREGITKLAEDLDALDRIDTKLGLEIELEPEDL